uniref:Putative secreted protein n=1 Tax=Anopheles marajoara TaxID=58244 RepID=A0A2M4CD35_9DIPT
MVLVPAMVTAGAVCSSPTATCGTFGAWCRSYRCAIRWPSVIPISTLCLRMLPSIWTGFGSISDSQDRAVAAEPR